MNKYRRMGDWLVQRGLLTSAQVDRAVAQQRGTKVRFGEILVASGEVSEAQVNECLAEQYCLPVADLTKVRSRHEARQMVAPNFALAHLLLPVAVDKTTFECVIADPVDLPVIDDLRRALNRRLVLSLAPPSALREAIERAYRVPQSPRLKLIEDGVLVRTRRRRRVTPQLDRDQLLNDLARASQP